MPTVNHEYTQDDLDNAVAAEREACIAAVAAEHVGESIDDDCDNEGDKAYNAALRSAVRALEERSNRD